MSVDLCWTFRQAQVPRRSSAVLKFLLYSLVGWGSSALLTLAMKLSMKNFREQGERVKEIPFSSETKVMEVVYQMGSSQVSFVKGALEMVLARCDSYLHHGKIVPLEG